MLTQQPIEPVTIFITDPKIYNDFLYPGNKLPFDPLFGPFFEFDGALRFDSTQIAYFWDLFQKD